MNTLYTPTPFSKQTEEFKDQVYISTVAWISIIFFGTILFFSGLKLFSLVLIFQIQAELFQEIQHDSLFLEIETLLLVGFSATIIFSIALLLGSVGMLRRRNWGRRLYAVSGVLAVLALVGAAIYYSYWYKQQMLDVLPFSVERDQIYWATWASLLGYGLFIIVVARSLLQSVFRLNKGKMLAYFY